MPRFPTFPTLYDEAKRISITDLKRWNYMKPGTRSGVITRSEGENVTGSISIFVTINKYFDYIELDYRSTATHQVLPFH